MKKYIWPISNIIVAFVFFIILLFSSLSENVVYLMMMTLVVGFGMPYLVLLITGLELLVGFKHIKMTFIFNLLNVFLCMLDLYFTIRLYDKNMIILLIEYIIMGIFSVVNMMLIFFYIKKNPNIDRRIENEEIKKIKQSNNGAIV